MPLRASSEERTGAGSGASYQMTPSIISDSFDNILFRHEDVRIVYNDVPFQYQRVELRQEMKQ